LKISIFHNIAALGAEFIFFGCEVFRGERHSSSRGEKAPAIVPYAAFQASLRGQNGFDEVENLLVFRLKWTPLLGGRDPPSA